MRAVLNKYFQRIDSNMFMIDFKEFYYCSLIRSFCAEDNLQSRKDSALYHKLSSKSAGELMRATQ